MRFGFFVIALLGCQPASERPQVYSVADLKDWVHTSAQNSPLDTHPGPLICSDSVLNDQAKSGFGQNITYFQPCYPMYDHPGAERRNAVASEQATAEEVMQKANEPSITDLMNESSDDHAQTVVAVGRAQEAKDRNKTGRPHPQTARR